MMYELCLTVAATVFTIGHLHTFCFICLIKSCLNSNLIENERDEKGEKTKRPYQE